VKKKAALFVCIFALFFLGQGMATTDALIKITGIVKEPLELSMADLDHYQSIQARQNGVMRDGGFRGVFCYRGFPLSALLELARIQKKGSRVYKIDRSGHFGPQQGRKGGRPFVGGGVLQASGTDHCGHFRRACHAP